MCALTSLSLINPNFKILTGWKFLEKKRCYIGKICDTNTMLNFINNNVSKYIFTLFFKNWFLPLLSLILLGCMGRYLQNFIIP